MMIILFLMITVDGSNGETFLVGPTDFDGFCPEPSHEYGKSCCCFSGCCWSNCRTANPPLSCLDGVPNSQWVFNRDKLWYQAVRNFNHQGTFPQCLKITEKVSFNIASEASYVYILSGQKFIKNAKNVQFWRVFENLKLAVKQCYQTCQF